MVNVKLVYGDDIRRLDTDPWHSNTLNELQRKVKEFYGIDIDNVVLKFKDDDGDLVTISNEDDVKHVLQRFYDALYDKSKGDKLQSLGGAKIWVSVKAKSNQSVPTAAVTSTPQAVSVPVVQPPSAKPAPLKAPPLAASVPKATKESSTNTTASTTGKAPSAERQTTIATVASTNNSPAVDLEVKLYSPYHPHELSLVTKPYGSNGFICDLCNRSGDSKTASWHCSKCHYDLCNQCAKPQLPQKKQQGDEKQGGEREEEKQQAGEQSKNERLVNEIIPLLLSFVTDNNIKQAFPIALSVGIDAYLTGADVSTVINTMIATSDDIKQHALTSKLLNILPQYIDRVERIASNIRVYARTIDPQMVGLAKTLIPVFTPQLLSNIESALREIIEQRQNDTYSRNDFMNAFHPVFNRLPPFMHGVMGNVFAQAAAQQQQQQEQGQQQGGNDNQSSTGNANTNVPPNINNVSPIAEGISELLKNVANPFGAQGDWQAALNSLIQQIGNVNVNVNDATEAGNETSSQQQVHRGIECDGCGAYPIQGRRFACNECRDFDFCENCYSSHSEIHQPTHTFKEIKINDATGSGDRYWRRGGRCGRRRFFDAFNGVGGPSVDADGSSTEGPSFGWWGHHGPRHHRGGHASHSRGRSRGRHHHHHHRDSSPTPPPPPPHHGFPHPPFFGVTVPPAAAPFFPPWFAAPGGHQWHHPQRNDSANGSSQARPQAVFLKDVNLPDRSEVETNSTIIKTWAVKNAGTQQWPEGTQLIVVRGDFELSSQEEFPVPLAKAGETVEVSAVLNVPSKHGRYSVYFRLADVDRNVFGPRIWCDIIAVQPDTSVNVPTATPAVNQQTQTSTEAASRSTSTSTSQDAEMDVDEVALSDALVAEAVNSTTLASNNDAHRQEPNISYPSLNENTATNTSTEKGAPVSSRSPTGSNASSSDSQKWNVVIEDDIESEDEKYDVTVENQEKKPLISKTQQPSEQEKSNNASTSTAASSTGSSTTSSKRDGAASPSPSVGSTASASGSGSSAQQYQSELATLTELGFTNQALNLFLLKQQQGNVKKVVEWLVERLQ